MRLSETSCAIIVCTRCRDPLTGALAAHDLLETLSGDSAIAGYRVETVACMAGCDRPLAVGFSGEGKASYLFGDVGSKDAGAISAFAELYRSLPDGWCNEGQRPHGLRGKIIARIPAARRVSS